MLAAALLLIAAFLAGALPRRAFGGGDAQAHGFGRMIFG